MTSKTKAAFQEGPLPILCSARVRLNNEQRATLKQAYSTASKTDSLVTADATGGLQVVTTVASQLQNQLGMSRLVVLDLLNSRDTISINLVLQLQEVLGVQVITKDDVGKSFQHYLDHLFSPQE